MPELWAVVGATGTGKSEVSLDLAEHLAAAGGPMPEIVNVDAMQLYRGMNIGTAKLREDERRGIRHHLFDELRPVEEATVARYQPEARARIAEILVSGADAILVGGSGLYASSVLFDFQFPPRDEAVRAALEADAERDGIASLVERLRAVAPDVADVVDQRNPRRVVRALEVALLGGDSRVTLPSEPEYWSAGQAHEETRIIGVSCERSVLTERLDRRVERMWAEGMLDEVSALVPLGLERGKTASRAIGYAQALAQLGGAMTESEAIAETQALTRRYARRQVSWFKRYRDARWIDQTERRAPAEEIVGLWSGSR